MGAPQDGVGMGVVVGDGEDRRKSFSTSSRIRSMRRKLERKHSQLYNRFDFSLTLTLRGRSHSLWENFSSHQK